MASVRVWIDKFKGVVLISEDHPLAVAQRQKDADQQGGDAERTPPVASQDTITNAPIAADTQPASVPAASAIPVPDGVRTDVGHIRKPRRRRRVES